MFVFASICFFDNTKDFASAIDMLNLNTEFGEQAIILFLLRGERFVEVRDGEDITLGE